jgi:hypothetical protein
MEARIRDAQTAEADPKREETEGRRANQAQPISNRQVGM